MAVDSADPRDLGVVTARRPRRQGARVGWKICLICDISWAVVVGKIKFWNQEAPAIDTVGIIRIRTKDAGGIRVLADDERG